jgi:membrane-associated phospholipid phosphatase
MVHSQPTQVPTIPAVPGARIPAAPARLVVSLLLYVATGLLEGAPGPVAGQQTAGDTLTEPSTLSRLEGAGAAMLSDTWSVLKAPANLDSDGAKTLLGIAGVGAALFAFDEQIDRMVQDRRDRPIPKAIEDVGEFLEPLGNVGGPTVLMTVGWAVAGATGQSKASLILQELVTAQLIGTATRHVARHIVGRSRPRDGEGAYAFSFGGGTSFPSGHASTITQVAWILSHHVESPWIRGAIWTGAGTVMYQRLTSGAHWASDVWFGAFWGWGIAKVVVAARESEWIELAPSVDPGGGGLGLQGRITF